VFIIISELCVVKGIEKTITQVLGAFVFQRSSKTWFNNVSQVKYTYRYLQTRNKTIHDMESMVKTKVMQSRSYMQGCFGSTTERETDLKGKRLSSPQWIVLKTIVNIKGMNVILHRLRPVPINRWTVPPYYSRWLVLARASRLYFHLLSSQRYKCNSILFLFIHDCIIRTCK
jgi:hypothetical protein